jgi:3-oxoacyl-[acyl-carrier protein] reductase
MRGQYGTQEEQAVTRLENKVALVTGAGRGIGRATALRLAQDGAKVAVNYHASEEAAREVVGLIESAGGTALAIKADVSDPAQVEAMVNQTIKDLGGLHVLVSNAGITRDNLLMRMSQQEWDDVLNTNLRPAFVCVKAATRQMVRQRYGRIIVISSVVALTGNVGQANYAAAKAGLIGFVKSVAHELGARNVTANAICPGFIETDITAGLSDEIKKAILDQIPAGRYGQPEDVASAIAFLASDDAAYVNGQVLNVDGGMVRV